MNILNEKRNGEVGIEVMIIATDAFGSPTVILDLASGFEAETKITLRFIMKDT